MPEVGIEPTRALRPADLESTALTARPLWSLNKLNQFNVKLEFVGGGIRTHTGPE